MGEWQGVVKVDLLKRFFFTVTYAVLYHNGYIAFSFSNFEYAGYKYFDASIYSYIYTYILAVFPSFFIKSYKRISYFGVVLIYLVVYVPSQLTIQFNMAENITSKTVLQTCLFVSFVLIFLISKTGFYKLHKREKRFDNLLIWFAVLFNLFVVFFLIYKYHNYMRFVGFADVYELRFETTKVQVPVFINYFQMWMTYLFIPFFIAIGVMKKNFLYVVFAVFLSVVIYLIQGSKLAILMFFTVYLLLYVYDRKGEFLSNLALYLSTFIALIFVLPSFGVLNWVKSLLFIRTLGTPGWMIVHYYEYFTENGYSYYGHINIINYIFGNYPFGELALGQLIGLEYSGSIDANFNANFWASDGLAALGLPGLFLISIVLGLFFKVLDTVSNGFRLRVLFIAMIGFWQALLNIPFMTALLSGGGILFMLILISKNILTSFIFKKSK
jgi:hypothetical protein